MSAFPGYSLNFRAVVKKSCIENESTIIDIGANIGDTVALIRPVTNSRIICIEGDEKYLKLLKINIAKDKNCTVINSFLGEQDELLNTKQVHENGTGRLVEDESSHIQIRSLDSLILNEIDGQIGLIKVDTDGFDNKIIRGASAIIDKFHPVLFFEYDPYFLEKAGEKGIDIFDFLLSKGYNSFEMYDNLGDLICTCKSTDKRIFEDLHQYFSGKYGKKYMDIAAYVI
jgi:FkbM family methyltransferase